MTPRSGSTLLELLVTLVIMGIVAGVATLTLRPAGAETGRGWYAVVSDARARALRLGTPVTIEVAFGDTVLVVTALPDGSVLAPLTVPVDRLTGDRTDAHP